MAERQARSPLPVPLDRRARILDLVAGAGFMSVGDIAHATGVSIITVRRDLAALEAEAVLRRTHGGAVPTQPRSADPFDLIEPLFEARLRRNMTQKDAIAARAARLIEPDETIALDVGTTALAFARALRSRKDVRVVTNNLRAAGVLSDKSIEVYVLGGRVRGREQAVGGARAVAEVAEHWFQTAVIGVSGRQRGRPVRLFARGYRGEAGDYIARASRVIVLADSSKFMRRALVRIAPLSAIGTLVCDRPPGGRLVTALAKAGVAVALAGEGEP
ncbi:MAG: DeoR/GlpR family DNA-binding transcription regulator [Hyphomicrobiaceae bacterium]